MPDLKNEKKVTIRIFGSLRQYMEDQGPEPVFDRELYAKETTAYKLAEELSLPLDKIEAVFRNGKIINIYDPVFPGDRIAFCPYGTPGPYRVFLGIARENEKRKIIERSEKHG